MNKSEKQYIIIIVSVITAYFVGKFYASAFSLFFPEANVWHWLGSSLLVIFVAFVFLAKIINYKATDKHL